MKRKFKILLWASCFVLILLIVLVSAAAYYQATADAMTLVNEHSACESVVNAGSYDLFVPTNTAGEWSSFRSNVPSGAGLSDCGYSIARGFSDPYYGYCVAYDCGSGFGSLYGSTTTYGGYTIIGVYSDTSNYVYLVIDGVHSKDFFTYFVPSDTSGNDVYASSDATYWYFNTSWPRTRWKWYAGSNVFSNPTQIHSFAIA